MLRFTAPLLLLAAMPLALTACATPSTTSAVDWNRPMLPVSTAPVFQHDMAIANPPYPRPLYANYLDEPTRFEFHPRPPILQVDDTPDDPTDNAVAADGSYLENGILYVDPNQ